MNSVSVCTLNINGLRNKNKRLQLFRTLKEKKYDIICLQETFVVETDKELWLKEWGGEIFFSFGDHQSMGQITLIRKGFPYQLTCVHKTPRILSVSFSDQNFKVNVVNVYAPCIGGERADFFRNITNYLNSLEGEMIVCGDFNCSLSNDQDIISGGPHRQSDINAFNCMVTSSALCDVWRLHHQDEKQFTWSRKNPFTARRLDYIFASRNMFDRINLCDIISYAQSDHRIIEMKYLISNVKRGPGYWKFNDSLLKDIEFVESMNSMINSFKEQNQLLDPLLKWDFCKIKIRELCIFYSKQKAAMRRDDLAELKKELNSIDINLSADPQNLNLVLQRDELKKKIEVHDLHEAKSAQVRSRIKYIEEGEKNTKYFLNFEKARANGKVMDSLLTEDGKIITEQAEILTEQVKFYKNIYTKTKEFDETLAQNFVNNVHIPTISNDQRDELETDLLESEVGRALNSLNNNSAPGPDGITNCFLKFFWIKIKDLVLGSFRAAFITGEMSLTQKQAIITLIHKGKELPRSSLSNWRPISLTNSDYKLLAKTMASRLSNVLTDIIHENQVGFVKGRKISHMIRLIDDTIEHLNISQRPGILLAIDYRRAFDSVSKEFIIWSFRKFGFGENFIKWVQVLTTNTMSAVSYLGWTSESFAISSGVRQGCPFSPMAFIIALEILAIKLRADHRIQGLDVPIPTTEVTPAILLKVLMYADDITLFLKGYDDLKITLDMLQTFSTFSNLELNKSKTEAMWLGSDKGRNDKYFDIRWKEKVKILGIFFLQ